MTSYLKLLKVAKLLKYHAHPKKMFKKEERSLKNMKHIINVKKLNIDEDRKKEL